MIRITLQFRSYLKYDEEVSTVHLVPCILFVFDFQCFPGRMTHFLISLIIRKTSQSAHIQWCCIIIYNLCQLIPHCFIWNVIKIKTSNVRNFLLHHPFLYPSPCFGRLLEKIEALWVIPKLDLICFCRRLKHKSNFFVYGVKLLQFIIADYRVR